MFIELASKSSLNKDYSLTELPHDLVRVLRMQFKEFIYYLDEAAKTNEEAVVPIIDPKTGETAFMTMTISTINSIRLGFAKKWTRTTRSSEWYHFRLS